MKTKEQIARALLDRVSYTEDDIRYITSREDIGYGQCQEEIKEILGIEDNN